MYLWTHCVDVIKAKFDIVLYLLYLFKGEVAWPKFGFALSDFLARY